MKQLVKNLIGNSFSIFDYPIVVNSYGRSGSTLLTKSIMKSGVYPKSTVFNKLASGSIVKNVWSLNGEYFKSGFVYKSHDYPTDLVSGQDIRMLYVFANPVDVVLSLLRLYDKNGKGWMKTHAEHLKISYENFDNILESDIFQLEQHINAWLESEQFPIAFIRYESMWDNQDDISNFLGFKVKLPPYRKRRAAQVNDKVIIKNIERTYGSLRNKVNKLADFFVLNDA